MGRPKIKVPPLPAPPPEPTAPEAGASAIRKPKDLKDRSQLAAQGTSQFRVPLFGFTTPLS